MLFIWEAGTDKPRYHTLIRFLIIVICIKKILNLLWILLMKWNSLVNRYVHKVSDVNMFETCKRITMVFLSQRSPARCEQCASDDKVRCWLREIIISESVFHYVWMWICVPFLGFEVVLYRSLTSLTVGGL